MHPLRATSAAATGEFLSKTNTTLRHYIFHLAILACIQLEQKKKSSYTYTHPAVRPVATLCGGRQRWALKTACIIASLLAPVVAAIILPAASLWRKIW